MAMSVKTRQNTEKEMYTIYVDRFGKLHSNKGKRALVRCACFIYKYWISNFTRKIHTSQVTLLYFHIARCDGAFLLLFYFVFFQFVVICSAEASNLQLNLMNK